MKLTANLAKSQLKVSRKRTVFTLLGTVLTVAMVTAVYGFVATGFDMIADRFEDAPSQELYQTTLVGLGAILSVIIVAASIIVVSNAFRVSAAERRAQFGMLKSVGATKQQIAQTVVYEGIFLSVLGMPAGVLLGFVVQMIGVQLINHIVYDMNQAMTVPLEARFVVAWQAILIAVAVSFGTMLLAAWLPARKAAKIAAIDAIRGAGEVKVEQKRVRSHWLAQKLFGIEGALAAKSLRRNRRNMRATIISLSMSVVLFVVVGAFGAQMTAFTEVYWANSDATAIVNFRVNDIFLGGGAEPVEVIPGDDIGTAQANEATERLAQFPHVSLIGIGSNNNYNTPATDIALCPQLQAHMRAQGWRPQDGDRQHITLIHVDPLIHAMLAEQAGVPEGSNILINHMRQWDDLNDRWLDFVPLTFVGQTLALTHRDNGHTREVELHGQLLQNQVPHELLQGNISVIVPELEMNNYVWHMDTEDPEGFLLHAEEVLHELFPHASLGLSNIQRERDSLRNIVRLVLTFTYGFIALLTLIGLTNVISTIATNVRTRAGEFAVLQSIGMTRGGVRRMLHLESLLCCAKALIIGLPLGLIGSLFIYQALGATAQFGYTLPWGPIWQCALGVLVIGFIAMRYAAAQLKGRSIIETIRTK